MRKVGITSGRRQENRPLIFHAAQKSKQGVRSSGAELCNPFGILSRNGVPGAGITHHSIADRFSFTFLPISGIVEGFLARFELRDSGATVFGKR